MLFRQHKLPAIEPLRANEAGGGMNLPQYKVNIDGASPFTRGADIRIAEPDLDCSAL